MIKFLVPSGPNKVEEHVPEEISLEESVLHELEVVMEQVSKSLNNRITMISTVLIKFCTFQIVSVA